MTTSPVSNMAGKTLTVKGLINPDSLGVTLMHEHLIWEGGHVGTDRSPNRFSPVTESAKYQDKLTIENLNTARVYEASIKDAMLITDEKMAIREASEIRNWGGSTVVDVTNIGRMRDPRSLFRISMATGLNIVMGCSWYGPASHPKNMDELSIDELTDEIMRDITVGVDDTGIKAGIIGEVGIGGNPLTPNEIKITRASARASRSTGAAISLHWGGLDREKLELASIIEAEGADLTRTIFGHSDMIAGNMPLMLELLEKGVYIQFDLLGRVTIPLTWKSLNPTLPWAEYLSYSGTALVAETIPNLINAGHVDKILISQDVCSKIQLKHYGGTGYTFIMETFLPHLRSIGVSEEHIEQIMIHNPKRVLTLVDPM